MHVRTIYRTCPACGARLAQPDDPGRKRRFCSDACKQAAYRARKRAREQARQRAEYDARLRAPDRTRRTPPPHAGTSRPGPFCGTCGGHHGPHTVHYDQAAKSAPGDASCDDEVPVPLAGLEPATCCLGDVSAQTLC